MSPIGRIFIVLNLILAAAFLGWASNALGTAENFKKQLEEAQTKATADLAAKDQELTTVRQELASTKQTQITYREERDTLQSQFDQQNGEVESLRRANSDMRGELTEIKTGLGDNVKALDKLREDYQAAVAATNEAESARTTAEEQAQAALSAQRDAQDAVEEANTKIADLETSKTSLQAEFDALDARAKQLVEITGVPLGSVTPQKLVEAAVVDFRGDLKPGFVMLNRGKNHGVERGYTFSIYSGRQYKGEARVENVQDDFCSAIVTTMVPGVKIAQGDKATTQL
jgi:hypothetical protein